MAISLFDLARHLFTAPIRDWSKSQVFMFSICLGPLSNPLLVKQNLLLSSILAISGSSKYNQRL